jgi:hypothetical protein
MRYITMHDHPDGTQVATSRSFIDGRMLRVVGENASAEMQKIIKWEATNYIASELKRLFP